MKRSPIKRNAPLERKTQLKPGGYLKRTPIKRISDKKRKEIRETMAIRKVHDGEICDVLGCNNLAEECHEITAGAYRHKAVYERLVQMHLCEECHRQLQGRPYAEQVAVLVHAHIAAVNRCCSREAIDVEDVIEQLTRS